MLDLLRTLIPSLAVRDIELSAHSFAGPIPGGDTGAPTTTPAARAGS